MGKYTHIPMLLSPFYLSVSLSHYWSVLEQSPFPDLQLSYVRQSLHIFQFVRYVINKSVFICSVHTYRKPMSPSRTFCTCLSDNDSFLFFFFLKWYFQFWWNFIYGTDASVFILHRKDLCTTALYYLVIIKNSIRRCTIPKKESYPLPV